MTLHNWVTEARAVLEQVSAWMGKPQSACCRQAQFRRDFELSD